MCNLEAIVLLLPHATKVVHSRVSEQDTLLSDSVLLNTTPTRRFMANKNYINSLTKDLIGQHFPVIPHRGNVRSNVTV